MPARRSKRFGLPMVFKVVVSDRVTSKIDATISYIENVCYNRPYAKRLYEAIEESVLGLETKTCFRVRDQEASHLLSQDVFRIKIGKYRLLYTVNDCESVVTVFSFFHEAQDLEPVIVYDFASAS